MGAPKSSWLNQLPRRPIAWAKSTPGAAASRKVAKDTRARRQPMYAPSAPSATAPQMPRPPSQMRSACAGLPFSPKYGPGVVTTWYSRPPTMPKGMAHMATSPTSSRSPPRATQRRVVSQMATKMPARMHSA